jgi:ankyrin repeat protein
MAVSNTLDTKYSRRTNEVHKAIEKNDPHTLSTLLCSFPELLNEPNIHGDTPLILALKLKHKSCVTFLLSQEGISTTRYMNCGITPLLLAAQNPG